MSLIVAIEGGDGAGKATAAAGLVERLAARGIRAELISFPRYAATVGGHALGEFLSGRMKRAVSPEAAAVLYALDRLESRAELVLAAERSQVLVMDRYIASNMAYQAAKVEEYAAGAMMDWILRIETDLFALPRPDLSIYLDTPLEVAQSATFNDDGEVNPAYVGDARDSSTPAAMVHLLAKLHKGMLLSAESTDYLFDVMARCVTGQRRIKGMLPGGTPVAHKTGTLAGVSDDVGIITLPNGHHLAVAIFAKGMRSEWERDRSIAQLARLLYEGFGAIEPAGSSIGRTIAR